MKRTLITLLLGTALLILSGCDSKATETDTTQAQKDRDEQIIIDDGYVLYDNEKLMKMYRDYNNELLKDYDIDFRVMTVSNEEDIDLFANKQFATLQKKSRSKSGKALLLVINTLKDKVRLEVSQALEPVYTDAFVSYIERKGFVPYFREYKIADGVYMATELVHDRAYEATQGKEFMPPMASKSIGGGAKTKSYIGIADPDAKKGAQIATHSSDDPNAVLQKYLKALKEHNKNPNLDIYTDVTKQFFAKWTVTDINQDHEVENISKCFDKHELIYDNSNTHAVLASRPYNVHRTCSPYFFKKEDGKWKLDIATMVQTLRFNAQMQWHFDMQKRLEGEGMYYAYAFDGYWFDKNGYPVSVSEKEKKPNDVRWGYQCNGWFYPQDKDLVRTQPEKYMRCWINLVWPGSPAQVRMGLDVYDYVVGVGEGSQHIEHATYKQFMDYMRSVPSGETTVVEVTNHGKKIIRRGIAP